MAPKTVDCRILILILLLPFTVAGCSRARSADSAYAQIRQEAQRGQLDTALRDADAALSKYGERDVATQWRFRVLKAHILFLQGSYAKSLQLLDEQFPSTLEGSEVAVRRELVRGLVHTTMEKYDAAEKDLTTAAQIAQTKQPSLRGDIFQAQGILYVDRKRYDEAATAFRSAAAIARERNLPGAELIALASLGNVAMWQEHYDEAIDRFKTALEKARSLGEADEEARALGNLGWSYEAMGDFENAEEEFKRAEEASGRAGLAGERIYWLNSLGGVYYQQRRYSEAEAFSEKALALAGRMDSKRTLTECLNTLSEAELATGRLDAAERRNRDALDIERAGLDQFGTASSTIIAARIAASKRRFHEAEEAFQKVVNDRTVETPLRWQAQARLAQVYADQNLVAKAEREFSRAIKTIETARSSIQQEEFRMSFLSSAIEFYEGYVDFLVSHSRMLDGLDVAELSRARTLAEGLATTNGATSPTLRSVPPQQIAQKLKASLLFYWIGQKNSYLWVITPAKTSYFKLPRASVIDPVVADYRKTLLHMHDAEEAGSADGKKLYAMLVDPAKKLIPRGSQVIVLPSESLYGLNFETLIVPDPQPHFWIEDVTLTTGSSLTLLAASASQPPKDKSLFLVGDTKPPDPPFAPLTQAAEEMKRVKKYFPGAQTRILEGGKATPTAFLKSNPEQFSYVHFVTHGTASRTRPLESAVILSQEGDSYKLYARDIVQHHLNASLVTISACNGAGARAYSGEGLVGLSWAFLRAGAHNVIGALWEVSDASTPQLMDAFYGELFQGKDPATALRDAKLSLLHSADPDSVFKKPFYWAPFQLYAGS